MSVDCVNALDNVDYTLLMTICPRFVCLSRVSLVADSTIEHMRQSDADTDRAKAEMD